MLLQTLQEIGLSEKEGKMYLLLLEMGTQSAAIMGKRMNIARTTSRFLLKSLVEKSFATHTIKNNVSYFTPEKPQTLKRILDVKVEKYQVEINQKKEKLDLITPLLDQSHQKNISLPKVIFYEGVDNVLGSYNEFLNELTDNDLIYNCVFPAPIEFSAFRRGMQKFIRQRTDKKIHSKTICTYGEDAVRLYLTDKEYMRETKINFTHSDTSYFSEVLLTDTKILDVSYSSNYTIFSSLIINENIAMMRKHIFEMAWKQAENEHNSILQIPEIKKWIIKHQKIVEY